MNIKANILETVGISSKIFQDGKFLGHVLLIDYDHMKKSMILENIRALDGISVLRESSETGYHVWNLTIRTRDDTTLLLHQMNDDSKHIHVGYQKNRWILRIEPKYNEKYEVYKPAPGDIEVYINKTDELQSFPHLEFLKERFRYRFKKIEPKFHWWGNSMQIERYHTVSDELKADMRNDTH